MNIVFLWHLRFLFLKRTSMSYVNVIIMDVVIMSFKLFGILLYIYYRYFYPLRRIKCI